MDVTDHEEVVEVAHVIALELVQDRTISQVHVQNRTVKQTVVMLAPQTTVEVGDVVHYIQQERVLNRTVQQIVDIIVPQLTEKIGEVVHCMQWRVRIHTMEQCVDVPMPQGVMERTVFTMPQVVKETPQAVPSPVDFFMTGLGQFAREVTERRMGGREEWRLSSLRLPERGIISLTKSRNNRPLSFVRLVCMNAVVHDESNG